MLERHFDWVSVIVNTSNPGYGAAANQGIRHTTSDTVLLLNSDTRVAPEALQRLESYFEQDPNVAIIGPHVLNPDQTLQASCYEFPRPLAILAEESGIGRFVRYVPFLRNRYIRTWSHDAPRDVAWVLGAALGIRRSSLQAIGGFDEQFHMYYEEVDLCYRLGAAGKVIRFVPDAMIEHVGGASTSQRRAETTRRVYTSLAQFYRKHYERNQLLQLRIVLTLVLLARIVRDSFRWLTIPAWDEQTIEHMRIWNSILRDVRTNWRHLDHK